MTLTAEVLEYIAKYPQTRIEDLEAFFDEWTKSQLLQAVRSLHKRGKIEWKTRYDMVIKTVGADSYETGWCLVK